LFISPISCAVIARHRSRFGKPDDKLQRTIQQSMMIMIEVSGAGYWMPRFRGA
jgi:hypothetical protein